MPQRGCRWSRAGPPPQDTRPRAGTNGVAAHAASRPAACPTSALGGRLREPGPSSRIRREDQLPGK
eukprot:6390705-Pyramimonas_sp.AAC.1